MASENGGSLTFLFTDIQGSTRLWEEHPKAMSRALAHHESLIRRAVADFGGQVFKTVGDSVCSVFSDADQALRAAASAQRTLAEQRWGVPGGLPVRMAIHAGAAEERDDDYFGPTLNRVARLLAAGHGGQVLISATVREAMSDDLSEGAVLRDMGERRLKDLTRPERIFQLVLPGLPDDFPPLRTLDVVFNNLPIQPTPLIGREAAVEGAVKLLREAAVRLLTMTGAGGSGKTRLALQVAAELVDEYDDGVFFVPLAPLTDPELVPSAIAQRLNLRESAGTSIAETLRRYVGTKRLLLLLDNFEHLIPAATLLADLMETCPGLNILVTSRFRVQLRAEREFVVPPLPLPDLRSLRAARELFRYPALMLFQERAAAVKPQFQLTEENARAVAEVCARLDGLPLAIELVAARVKVLSPAEMLARLGRSLDLMSGGPLDLPERQRTLRKTIEWSYRLLNEGEKAVFRRASLFVGGFGLEAGEAICAAPENDGIEVIDVLQSLVDKSLLRREEPPAARFQMLETVREYGVEELAASGEERGIRATHARFFVAFAAEASQQLEGADQSTALERIEGDHDNLRAALAWTLEEEPEAALHLAVSLWRFWALRGHLGEGQRWLEQVLARSTPSDRHARAAALLGAGVLARLRGDTRTARRFLEESAEMLTDLGDVPGRARALSALAVAVWMEGDVPAARSLCREASTLLRSSTDIWGRADALHYLGHMSIDQGNYLEAKDAFQESLTLFRKTGDKANIAQPLKDLGLIAARSEEFSTARNLYEESLALLQEVGDKWHIADTLNRLGEMALAQGELGEAESYSRDALGLFEELGSKQVVAETLNRCAEIAELRSDYQEAKLLYESALALAEELDSQRLIAATRYNIGSLAIREENYEGAISSLAEALRLYRELGRDEGVSLCLSSLAAAAAAMGRHDDAGRIFGLSDRIAEGGGAVVDLFDRIEHPVQAEDFVAQSRDALGEKAFSDLCVAGADLSVEEAIALALGQTNAP